MSKRIAVLDIDSIAYSIGAGNKVLDEAGQPIKVLSDKGNMVFQYVEKTKEELNKSADWIMDSILTKCESTHYVGLMKGSGTTLDRLTVNPEYKKNRKEEPPRWWHYVQQYLFKNWQCCYVDNMETDDAVNITRLQLPDSFIVAIDSDVLSQPGTHFNWKTSTWVTTTEKDSNLLFWESMIVGTHNNTKGVPGKGKKYFEKLLDQKAHYDPLHFDLHLLVYDEYIKHFGEYKGTKEFYSNYICNKLLIEKEGFVVPEPIPFKRIETNLI